MSAIPTSLQREMDELEAMHKAAVAPQENAPAAQAQAVQQDPVPQPDEPAPSGNILETPEDETRWQHKYNVINGKYVAETGRLRQELRETQAEAERLRALEKPAPVEDAPVPAPLSDADIHKYVSPDLVEEFGMDYWKQQISIQRKLNEERLAPIEARQKEIERATTREMVDQYKRDLSVLVPDWQTVNDSKEWNTFLGQVDPITGETYEQLLRRADSSLDSARVSEFFKMFRGTDVRTRRPASVGNQVVPVPGASAGPSGEGRMTFEEWNKQVEQLLSSGLPPAVVHQKISELDAALQKGRMTGLQNDPGPPGRGFV